MIIKARLFTLLLNFLFSPSNLDFFLHKADISKFHVLNLDSFHRQRMENSLGHLQALELQATRRNMISLCIFLLGTTQCWGIKILLLLQQHTLVYIVLLHLKAFLCQVFPQRNICWKVWIIAWTNFNRPEILDCSPRSCLALALNPLYRRATQLLKLLIQMLSVQQAHDCFWVTRAAELRLIKMFSLCEEFKTQRSEAGHAE